MLQARVQHCLDLISNFKVYAMLQARVRHYLDLMSNLRAKSKTPIPRPPEPYLNSPPRSVHMMHLCIAGSLSGLTTRVTLFFFFSEHLLLIVVSPIYLHMTPKMP